MAPNVERAVMIWPVELIGHGKEACRAPHHHDDRPGVRQRADETGTVPGAAATWLSELGAEGDGFRVEYLRDRAGWLYPQSDSAVDDEDAPRQKPAATMA